MIKEHRAFFLTNYFYSLLDHALNQPAKQSSTYESYYKLYKAERAVDGNFLTWSETDNQPEPWWRVDLGSSLPVAEVAVYTMVSWHVYEIRIGEFRAL